MTEEWKEVSATWKGDLNFFGEDANGGSVHMDIAGEQPGIGPMKLVLVGLAGCTGIDIVSIFQKNFSSQKVINFYSCIPNFMGFINDICEFNRGCAP